MERDDSPSDVEKIISRNKIWLYVYAGADPGFLKRGSILSLGLQKKGGGGYRRGPNFGRTVKKPTTWPRKGGPDPMCIGLGLFRFPQVSAYIYIQYTHTNVFHNLTRITIGLYSFLSIVS